MDQDEEKCESCKFWREDDLIDCEDGTCHRYPPHTAQTLNETTYFIFWPRTERTGWCGEWKEKSCQN